MVTREATVLPVRDRLFHAGTNRSAMMYPIVLDPYTSPNVWKLPAVIRTKLYGKDNIVGQSGANYLSVQQAEGKDTAAPNKDDEPAFSSACLKSLQGNMRGATTRSCS